MLRQRSWLMAMVMMLLGSLPRASAQPSPLPAEVKEATKDVAEWVSAKKGFKDEFNKVSESFKPYVGKVIAMEGRIQVHSLGGVPHHNQPAIILEDRGDTGVLVLTFYFDRKHHDQVRMLSNGQAVTLKGTLTEKGAVKDSSIVTSKENPGVRITAEEFAAQMDRNPLRLRRLLEYKSVVMEGEVAEMEFRGLVDSFEFLLPGKVETKEKRTLKVRLFSDFDRDLEKPVDLRIGQRVTIKGSVQAEWIGQGDAARWVFEIGYANWWHQFPDGVKFQKWQDYSKVPPGVLKVKLPDFAKEHADQRDKTVEKYQGRLVEITGKMDHLSAKEKPLTDAPVIVMRFDEPGGLKHALLCHFKPAHAARIAKLKPGQQVTILGELEFGTLFDNGMFNCDLIKG